MFEKLAAKYTPGFLQELADDGGSGPRFMRCDSNGNLVYVQSMVWGSDAQGVERLRQVMDAIWNSRNFFEDSSQLPGKVLELLKTHRDSV